MAREPIAIGWVGSLAASFAHSESGVERSVSEIRTGSPEEASTPARIAAPLPRLAPYEITRRSSSSSAATLRARAAVSSVEPSSTRITSQSTSAGPPARPLRDAAHAGFDPVRLVVGGDDEARGHGRSASITNW